MTTKARVLVVEDDEAMLALLAEHLQSKGYETATASSPREALTLAADPGGFDLVVTDVRLGAEDGVALVDELRERAAHEGEQTPGVIVVTAFGTLETAVRAFRSGASDYLTKPFELPQLTLSVERVLESRRLRGEIRRLRRAIEWKRRGDIVAASPQMRAVMELVERTADSDATVLVTGASGTGKELVARALHERSRRADGPFIAVNCAALPESILESELFGYRKGAFTDARNHKEGLIRAADGGTLLLDEVAEMPLSLQPKLLRVLQEREVTPLGATRPEPIDVRVVASTNQDVDQLVAERRFREDLFYRLNVIRIELPPLSTRPEDVLPLAEAYLERSARSGKPRRRLSAEAQAALAAYAWPGNVRELENALERALALSRGDEIRLADLPQTLTRPATSALVDTAVQRRWTLARMETEYCVAAVRFHGGNQSAAARHLGIDRKTLARKLAEHHEHAGTGTTDESDEAEER